MTDCPDLERKIPWLAKLLLACAITGLPWGSAIAQTDSSAAETTKTNVVATVLGKQILAGEGKDLNGLIFGPLLGRFAEENKIAPTDEELDAFVIKSEANQKREFIRLEQDRARLEKDLQSSSLKPAEAKAAQEHLVVIEKILKTSREMREESAGREDVMRSAKRRTARVFVGMWKINRALYQKYGGRVIFQQAGPEPLDAYRDFLRDQEKQGNFQIIDKSLEDAFWRYYTNSSMHVFYESDEGAKFINTPWWMMEEPPQQ